MKPKKIILVVIDSLRQDHLGCYGYKRNTTPNMDTLAKSGIQFKHAFSVCPNTVPSLASILTSKYPGNHSIGFDPEGKLNPQADRTLASILKENNYRTIAFSGRNGLSGLNPGFDIFDDGEGRRDCQATNEMIFEWLDENYGQDFFMFIHYFDTHGPYMSPEPFKNMFVNDEFYGQPEYIKNISDKEPAFNSIPGYQILNLSDNLNNDPSVHENDIRYYRAQYDACIRFIDDNIGKLLEKLKNLTIYDDSLIIITSDHGEAFGENNVFLDHGLSVTLDQIAVPLIIKQHKGWNVKCDIVNIHVSTLDIVPTILSSFDFDERKIEIDGSSLKTIIEDHEDHVLKERTLKSENEYQYALIRPSGLMELWKKDSPGSTYYSKIPDMIFLLNGKKYHWDSGYEYILSLPFDQYQRYKIIADIINKFRNDKQIFTIIDIGAGFEEILNKFLPYDDICFFDKDLPPGYSQKNNYIIGDIIKEKLNETYDFVISIDAYEHIPSNSREKFVINLLHISKIATIIAAPFDTPGVREHEILANESYKLTHGFEFKWLHEHIQNGLPSLPFTLEIIKKSGFNYTVIPNGYLPRWFEMISIYLITENKPDFQKSIKELYEFYNNNFYCYDNLAPAYRQVIIINKTPKNYDFSDIYAKDPEIDEEFNLKYRMLQSILKNMRDIYSIYISNDLIEKEYKIKQLTSQILELNGALQEESAQIIKLKSNIHEKNTQITQINKVMHEKNTQITQINKVMHEKNTQIMQLNNIIYSMQESIVTQILMKFQRGIEYILPPNTRRRRTYETFLIYGRIAMKYGLRSLWQKYRDDRKAYRTLFRNNITIPKLDIKIVNSLEDIVTILRKVSIVIPTKNAGPDFEFTLEKIKNQKGIKYIEIIIVDSGSNDDTIEFAKKYGSKIYIIKPEDFNHGATRNFGAEKATGDHVLFMVQDAMPIGEYLLYNMVKALESEEKIAAITCRQVPRSDADMFACSSLWNHYRMLDFHEDRVSSLSQNFNSLSLMEKRKVTGLEDVCCLVKKDIFNNLKFKNIQYAEDLEFGLRLLENKYQIAFLYSVGVIHTHNRTPIYFLKRSYLDTKLLPEILSYDPIYFFKENNTIDDIFSKIIMAYMVLNASIESLKSLPFDSNATDMIEILRSLIIENSKKDFSHLKKFELGDNTLNDILTDFKKIIEINTFIPNDLMANNYFYLLNDFKLYCEACGSPKDKKIEFIETLYKIFSVTMGSALANYYLFKEKTEEIDDKMLEVDRILSGGI